MMIPTRSDDSPIVRNMVDQVWIPIPKIFIPAIRGKAVSMTLVISFCCDLKVRAINGVMVDTATPSAQASERMN